MTQYVDAATVWHVDIQQHDGPGVGAQSIESLVARRRLADLANALVLFEELPDPRAHHRMIICNEYANHGCTCIIRVLDHRGTRKRWRTSALRCVRLRASGSLLYIHVITATPCDI